MNNRRYFLVQSTLATTALFALKPLKGMSRAISQVTGLKGGYNKLSFFHTTNLMDSSCNKVIEYFHHLKNKNTNAILLHAGTGTHDTDISNIYDASVEGDDEISVIKNDYKIITKGNVRTGIVYAKPGDINVIQKVKMLSKWLKKDKSCAIVVCLSQLGYKTNNGADDITLAHTSTHLDIIVGGHKENFHKLPIVALNSNNAEVIIHSVAGNTFDCGQIEIDFDDLGRKNKISFALLSSKSMTIAISAA